MNDKTFANMEPKKNIWERSKEIAEEEKEDLTSLDREMIELGFKHLDKLDLQDGDILVLQARREIHPDQLRRFRVLMSATKRALNIDVNYLVIPHDFKLRILRPSSSKGGEDYGRDQRDIREGGEEDRGEHGEGGI